MKDKTINVGHVNNEKDNGKRMIRGAMILAVAGLLSKLIGAAFKIPLTNIIGAEGFSYYGVAYPVYQFFYVISTAGFPVAIARMVSKRVAKGDYANAKKAFILASKVIAVICFMSFLICFFGAGAIARAYKNPGAEASIRALSLALLFVAIAAPLRGLFQGLQTMTPIGISNIVEQLIRTIVGLALALIFCTRSLELAAAGATFGASSGMIAAAILLILYYMKDSAERKNAVRMSIKVEETERDRIKELLYIVIPVTIGSSVMPIMMNVDAAVVMRRLQASGWTAKNARTLYGLISGYCDPIANLPIVFIDALSISLMPAVTIAYSLNQKHEIGKAIQIGLKSMMIIVYPCTTGLIILAGPILHMLFRTKPEEAELAITTLQILSLGIVSLAVMRILTSCLQGIGRMASPVINLSIGALCKVIITYFLVGIPNININGAALGTVAAYSIAAILNYRCLRRRAEIKVPLMEALLKPLIPSLIMGLTVFVVFCMINFASGNNTLSTCLSIIVAIIEYFILIFITGVVTEDDIEMIPRGKRIKEIAAKMNLIK